MKEIKAEELAKCDGKQDKPVYIAHEGRVFDVSESKLWAGGRHMNIHQAGRDLTADIKNAPHGIEVLERYPHVAILKKETTPERKMPPILQLLLHRFPMLKRHPHPMTVHFPIVFAFAVVVFTLIALLTGKKNFELTALHCLGAGLLFTPVAIVTGYFTWWLNYAAKPLKPVIIKQVLSFILLGAEFILFVWRLMSPDILWAAGLVSAVYLILIISLILLVSAIGWFGATLTFPVERD